ncbi:hypothetical protein ACWDKQ_23725 [Saccharopolyspora sp. NPDC000995]
MAGPGDRDQPGRALLVSARVTITDNHGEALRRLALLRSAPGADARRPTFTVTKEAAQRIRPVKPPGSQSPEPPKLPYDALSWMSRRCSGTGSSED